MRLPILIVCSIAYIAVNSVGAQSSFAPAISTVAEPTASATTQRVGPAVQASITSKDKTAKGSLGTTFGLGNGGELNPWLGGSGPLDENNQSTPVILADLSLLRSASKASAGINYLHWNWKNDPSKMFKFCRRAFSDSATAPDSLKKLLKVAASAANPNDRAQQRESAIQRFVDTQCGSETMPPELRGPFLEEADFGRIWLAGASADYGRSTFRYADTVNAAFKSQVEEPFALNLGVGLYIPTKRMLVAANIRREQAFDGGAARQYCIPTGAPGATQCRSVALGAPTERNATLVSLETRWFVTEHYGLSPRFTANTSATKEIGFELPIVVRQDTDEGFNSAFAIGWKSKASSPDVDDRIYVSLILGVTYGVGLKF